MRWLLMAMVVAVSVSACSERPQPVTVLAASSLQDIVPAVLEANGLHDIRLSFAASSTLARQLEAGAAADIFLSANVQWMDQLVTGGIVRSSSPIQVIGNQLVVVAHPDALARAQALSLPARLGEALGPGNRLAMGDPAHVPAGRYARAALERLGMWTALASRVALTDNVRAVLALVARGEAPLGIVYATDALLEPDLPVVARLPADPDQSVVYSFALIDRERAPGSDAVFRALTDATAMARYRAAGFVVL